MWDDYFDTQYGRDIYGNYNRIRDYCIKKAELNILKKENGYRIYMIDGRTRIMIPLSLKYESPYRKMEYITDTYCLTEDETGSLELYLSDEAFITPECIEAKPEWMEVEKEKTPEEELEELKSKIETRLKQKEKKITIKQVEDIDKKIIIKEILVFFVAPLVLLIGAALIIHLGG